MYSVYAEWRYIAHSIIEVNYYTRFIQLFSASYGDETHKRGRNEAVLSLINVMGGCLGAAVAVLQNPLQGCLDNKYRIILNIKIQGKVRRTLQHRSNCTAINALQASG